MKRRKLSKAEKVQVQRIMGGFRYLVEIGVLVPKLEVKREVNYARWMEETYSCISDAGPQGISISALRGLVSCGNSTLDECLDRLKAAGRIVRNPDKRWGGRRASFNRRRLANHELHLDSGECDL